VRRILVIRFGALGDLCLLSWSLAGATRQAGPGRCHLTLVTKQTYAGLMASVPGVDAVESLYGSRTTDLLALARRLRTREWDAVLDAHGSLRSRLLLLLLGRGATTRLRKDTPARLALLFLRRCLPSLQRTMHDRFREVLAPLAAPDDPPPALPPLERPAAGDRPPALGIAPGARWDTKRWSAARFLELLRMFRREDPAPVRIFLGPDEAGWFPGSPLAGAAGELPDVSIERFADLTELARALGGCATLLTNDSGLLHLAEAVGTPVLALFGPTVREFGYFPSLPRSRSLERELFCRPCSRNGRRPCWRGDHACLEGLEPEQVLATLRAMPPWSGRIPGKARDG
jgi:heptosyltransferase-2